VITAATQHDQTTLDTAAGLLDAVANQDNAGARATWCLLATDRLVRAGAAPVSTVVVDAEAGIRQAMQFLSTLSEDLFADELVHAALEAARRAYFGTC